MNAPTPAPRFSTLRSLAAAAIVPASSAVAVLAHADGVHAGSSFASPPALFAGSSLVAGVGLGGSTPLPFEPGPALGIALIALGAVSWHWVRIHSRWLPAKIRT